MKQTVLIVVLAAILIVIAACAPREAPTTGEAVVSPEEKEIASGLDDLNELDTLDQELEQDVSFDEVDQLLK